jgi:hypothetical protein
MKLGSGGRQSDVRERVEDDTGGAVKCLQGALAGWTGRPAASAGGYTARSDGPTASIERVEP